MSDELDLGNLAITITDGEPAEAKFDLPNGTSVTRTFPESGTINMRLGLGLSLSHQRPPAGGGGEGEPEALADANLAAGTYTVGATSYAVGDLFAGIAGAFTTFDPADVIGGSGLRGSQEGGTSTPSLIGALKDVILGVDGSVVLFDLEIDGASFDGGLCSLDVSDVSGADFMPGNYAIFASSIPGNAESELSGTYQQVDGTGAEVAACSTPSPAIGTFGLHRIAIRVSRGGIGIAFDGDENTLGEAVPNPLMTWADFNGVGIYAAGYKFLKRIRVYDKNTDLLTISALA